MSADSGKTAAAVMSLAIVEKKPQRPGGCAGIFFQLIDWNKRFAKKKIFSKKLLAPVRLKKASKKFGGDDKQPKLRLIANENSGGFPCGKRCDGDFKVDSEQKHEMRTPGLIARLMGLEVMPALQKDKLKKDSVSRTGRSNEEDKFLDCHGEFERQELAVEKGEPKHELRPQKLQKTGISERRAVTRFGAETFQLKNVLPRSRKQQHPKLMSPVKSPRNVSGKNACRLIGAATRILEPGLQRSKSKCALTYSTAVNHPPSTENLMKKPTGISLEPLGNSNYLMNAAAATAQNGPSSSCRNCAHLIAYAEEQPLIFSPMSKNSCLSSGQMDKPRIPTFCPMRGNEKDQETSRHYTSSAMDGGQPRRVEYMVENKPLNREGQRQWQTTSPHRKFQRDVRPSVGLKPKGLGQKHTLQERDRLPLPSKLSRPQGSRVSAAANATNGTRNLTAMDRNLSNHTRLTMSAKMDNCQLDTNRKNGERKPDSLSPVQKRRFMNTARLNESNALPGKETCSKLQESSRNGDDRKNETDVVSFTFNSQTKRKLGMNVESVEKRKQNGPNCGSPVKKLALQNNDQKRIPPRSCPMSGDSLGALLEQKLRELTCQEEGESSLGENAPKKTTAMILQELISALTTERPFNQDDLSCSLENQENRLCADYHQAETSSPTGFQSPQVDLNSTRKLVGCVQDRKHLSPGSVLEACFSNESCASSSLDDVSGHNVCAESNEFFNEQPSLERDIDILDFATSLGMGRFCAESVITVSQNISEVFSKINLADVHLKGGKLGHAEEVILNTQLVFGNAALPGALANEGFSIGLFVLNELETLASVMCANFGGNVGFDGHQLKGFIFDCVIEYLDSRFSRYWNSRFSAWIRLPLRMKTEMLIGDIVEEVGIWAELGGLMTDELIEYEMSHSLGKWIDFELEAFETGAEFDREILQTLIDELVIDFNGCSSNSLDISCSLLQVSGQTFPLE